jgi:hypothetical protein
MDRDAAAAYLDALLEELKPLAQQHGLHVVAYLLDMAHLEVRSIARQSSRAAEESRRQQ